MGQPKLLLTLAGVPIIERLLLALDRPAITSCSVIVRAGDVDLQREVSRLGGSLVVPAIDPPDMRASVSLALDSIQRDFSPLWSIWRAERNPTTGAASQSLLWNLYRRDTTPDTKKSSFFFGLFQSQSGPAGKQARLFYIPIKAQASRPTP